MKDVKMESISRAVDELLGELPSGVMLVAAAKSRSPGEVEAAVQAGVTCVGQNYVQEAEQVISDVGSDVKWHMIGHLQRNKAKKAMRIFDMIQTVDSWRLALALERAGESLEKTIPVLVEINSGREPNKTGVVPEDVTELVKKLSGLEHLQVEGLMTMGPRFGDPEAARPFFRATKEAFESLKSRGIPNVAMKVLSMGMSNSYRIAIEEGANMVRVGSRIFGERPGGEDCRRPG